MRRGRENLTAYKISTKSTVEVNKIIYHLDEFQLRKGATSAHLAKASLPSSIDVVASPGNVAFCIRFGLPVIVAGATYCY